MGRRLCRRLATVRAVSSDAPTPVVEVTMGDPPPSKDSVRKVLVCPVVRTGLGGNGGYG
jgi:hypothetical protein